MRGEQEDGSVPPVRWEVSKGRLDAGRDRFDKAGVHAPPVDDAPFDGRGGGDHELLGLAVELVQAAPCRGAAVLWVLRERYRTVYPVLLKPPQHFLGEWIGVPVG